MHLFYSTDIADGVCTLDENESAHCIRVLRLAEGSPILITDGRGGLYDAHIAEPHPKHCRARITGARQGVGDCGYFLHIGVALPKSADRCDFLIEKIAEIGVSCITPILCDHSERKSAKNDHWHRILISALKQSQGGFLPILHPLTPFANLVRQPFDGIKCIAHCHPLPRTAFGKAIENHRRILVLIGAEGDFSPAELTLAEQCGFVGVSLGIRRLRTETAAIVACHTVAMVCGREGAKG